MTDRAQSQSDDAMTDRARRDGAGEDAGSGTDRPIRDRIRERLDRARNGDAGDRDTLKSDNLDIDLDLSDLDANARKRLRFLRALQQKRSGRG